MSKSLPPQGQKLDNQSLDLSDDDDDEELREQLDMHSIIVSCINEEPLFTAEQVVGSHLCSNCTTLFPSYQRQVDPSLRCSCIQLFRVLNGATAQFKSALCQPIPTSETSYICTDHQ